MTSWWINKPREHFAEDAAVEIAPAPPEVEDYLLYSLENANQLALEGWVDRGEDE